MTASRSRMWISSVAALYMRAGDDPPACVDPDPDEEPGGGCGRHGVAQDPRKGRNPERQFHDRRHGFAGTDVQYLARGEHRILILTHDFDDVAARIDRT